MDFSSAKDDPSKTMLFSLLFFLYQSISSEEIANFLSEVVWHLWSYLTLGNKFSTDHQLLQTWHLKPGDFFNRLKLAFPYRYLDEVGEGNMVDWLY